MKAKPICKPTGHVHKVTAPVRFGSRVRAAGGFEPYLLARPTQATHDGKKARALYE